MRKEFNTPLWSENVKRYKDSPINIQNFSDCPIETCAQWLQEATHAKLQAPNAAILGTTPKNTMQPSARTVLVKEINDKGLVFYTHYESDKAKEIAQNNKVSLLFLWTALERQIRILGHAKTCERKDNERYFSTRPKESQLGAWTSNQSERIPNNQYIHEKYETIKKRFNTPSTIPCPPYWGGFLIIPSYIEFWKARKNRLHDRIAFQRNTNTKNAPEWESFWLSP